MATQLYGFLVKPFLGNDLLVTLQIAQYHHENGLESQLRKQTQLATINAGLAGRLQRLLMVVQVLQPFFPSICW